MGKKPTKKNTKPMVVEIDDKPLLDTSNLDTSIAPASTTTNSNKKDNKKNTTTTTPSTTTEKEQPKNEPKQVETKNNNTTAAPVAPPSANVVVAPSIEVPITDDFSVVPEKNKNKKKVAPQTETNKQNAAALAAKNKKTGITRNQFHLLDLDEDDIVTDDTHTHNYEVQNQQQTKKTKKSKSTKSSSSSSEAKTKSTKSDSSTKSAPVVAPVKKEEKKAEPVKEQPKAVAESKPKKSTQSQQQNKKSEGVFFELMNSIITPGVPTIVYKIIYFALIGVLLFSLVPLYYSGLNQMYMVGVVGLVIGLAVTLTLFIQEFSRVKELKESKGGKKATSRKLK